MLANQIRRATYIFQAADTCFFRGDRRGVRRSMTRIQSSVGLITGIPIEDTVNQLMEIAAQPRNMVTERNKLLQAESVGDRQALVAGAGAAVRSEQAQVVELVQFPLGHFERHKYADRRDRERENPAAGKYLFTPIQTATAQQWMSQSISSSTALGEGSLTIRIGGFLDKGIGLDELNGGAGITRGEIRVTDRSGQLGDRSASRPDHRRRAHRDQLGHHDQRHGRSGRRHDSAHRQHRPDDQQL